MRGSTPESPRKRMKRAKKQPPPPDQAPSTSWDAVDNTMMDLLLDMSSQMQTMGKFVAKQNPLTPTGIQGSIPYMSGDHTQLDDAATTSSTQVAADYLETSGTIATPLSSNGSLGCMSSRGEPVTYELI